MIVSKPSSELLKKYAKAGPRYTSYPTAPVWNEYVNSHITQKVLEKYQEVKEDLGLYFHFPFCPSHCSFCGCNVIITKNRNAMDSYLDTMRKELELLLPSIRNKTIAQLQFGGGSPSVIPVERLREILETLRENLNFREDAEIGIELNPESTNEVLLGELEELGFNRISFGVQDLNEEVQKEIRRVYPERNLRELMTLTRKFSFRSVNFDLIYGLPKQTLESFQSTVEAIIQMRPDRIALYSYAHIPWLKPLQRSFDSTTLPDDSLKLDLFLEAIELFTEAGYEFLGMDHFALPEDDLTKAFQKGSMRRNFMGYTTHSGLNYLGLGMTSIGYYHHHFFQNEKKLSGYQRKIERDSLAVSKGFELDYDDLIRQSVIQNLMTNRRLDFREFEKEFQIAFPLYFDTEYSRLLEFQEDGLLTLSEDGILLKQEGVLFLRNVAMIFDRYLSDNQEVPMFSRTV